MINIIVAIANDNAIGKDNKLLFKLKKDLENFKEITTDNIVVMGRNTFESIGKPLPNRINVVLSKNPDNLMDFKNDIIIYDNLEDAIEEMSNLYPNKEIFIIGGGKVYKEALDKGIVSRLYMTKVKKIVRGADTFFPDLDYRKEWFISDVKRYFEKGIEYFIYQVDKRNEK